jgi:aminoglycoside phosphotransferase
MDFGLDERLRMVPADRERLAARAAAVGPFFTAYGLGDPDRRRLDYYRLLDELF